MKVAKDSKGAGMAFSQACCAPFFLVIGGVGIARFRM
jgi:hypothetical protein